MTQQTLHSTQIDIRGVAAKLSAESGLPIVIEQVSAYPAQPFHLDMIGAVGRAAEMLGYSSMPAVSGAGHDAVYMARLAPAGMIFIPCMDGISHDEIEIGTQPYKRAALTIAGAKRQHLRHGPTLACEGACLGI